MFSFRSFARQALAFFGMPGKSYSATELGHVTHKQSLPKAQYYRNGWYDRLPPRMDAWASVDPSYMQALRAPMKPAFTLEIGAPYDHVTHVTDGHVVPEIPSAQYYVFSSTPGRQPEPSVDGWNYMWNYAEGIDDRKHLFSGDFEIRESSGFPNDPKIQFFIKLD